MNDRPGPDAILDTYQRQADSFARNCGTGLFEQAWLDRLIDGVGPNPSVLDLGCGSGDPLATYLIGKGCTLTGIDGASSMISLCQKRHPDQEWITADMRGINLGRTFDAIMAWNSFFHLSHQDQQEMFPVFEAHAHSGTRLMFTSGPDHGEVWGQAGGEIVYHASHAPQAYREFLTRCGFKLLKFVPEDPDCNGHTVWLAEKV